MEQFVTKPTNVFVITSYENEMNFEIISLMKTRNANYKRQKLQNRSTIKFSREYLEANISQTTNRWTKAPLYNRRVMFHRWFTKKFKPTDSETHSSAQDDRPPNLCKYWTTTLEEFACHFKPKQMSSSDDASIHVDSDDLQHSTRVHFICFTEIFFQSTLARNASLRLRFYR